MVQWRLSVWIPALLLLVGGAAAPALAMDTTAATGLILPDDKPMFADERPFTGIGQSDEARDDNEPVTMEAEAVGYDKDNAIAIARGNVTVAQGKYVLTADKITYYQMQNLVVAQGNVSVLQPSGDVIFAEEAELKDNMERGVVQAISARMADNSVFAAREARKIDVATTELKKAVYTPCNLCSDAAPFWQIKASEMRIDEREEEITYRNARMEMGGVPILYTPYMSQPTPGAPGRSGFLTPEYSSNNNLGRTVKVPYYWRIAHDKDLTVTPWYLSEEDWLLQGDYRQLTDGGNYEAQFSVTNPTKRDGAGNRTDGREMRGHIFAHGEEEIGEHSRLGLDINRTTDDTYIRRYGFGAQRVLFSRVYAEAAEKRNYALAQALAIQGLRATDNPDTTPQVLPMLEGYYETTPNENGMRLHAFGNVQSLTREIGADQHRVSATVGGSLPYVSEGGHILTSTVNLRQDVYNVDNVTIPGDPSFDGTITRTIPQGALEWRYPLINPMTSGDSITLEPIVMAVAQPNGGNPVEIPNEDNTLIELTDTNLFALDRMPGLDTVDSGTRVAYGFRTRYLFTGGESIDALLGQNYSFSDDTPFPNSTTPGQNASDVIGRLGLFANPIGLTYRFALDQNTMSPNRNELGFSFSKPWLNFQASYRSLDDNRYLSDREEAIMYASVPLSDEWSIFGSGRRDLTVDQMIATGAGLTYQNECFSLMLQALRTYTRDRDIEPNTSITLRVGFKNLGEFGD